MQRRDGKKFRTSFAAISAAKPLFSCSEALPARPCRIRAHLLGLKGQSIGKCHKISVEIKEEVKRLIKDASGPNVDLNDDVNVDASGANVVLGSSMPTNDLPLTSFVSSSSSKRKVLDKDEPLAMSWKKQLHKNADETIRRFFFV